MTSRLPFPLNKGDRLRAFYQLEYLNKHHEVHLVCLNDEGPISEEQVAAMKSLCQDYTIIDLGKLGIAKRLSFATFKNKWPYQVHYFYEEQAQTVVDKIVDRFQPQHIVTQLIRTSEYVRRYKVAKTLDMMDALSRGMERRSSISKFPQNLIFKEEAKRLSIYENEVLSDFDHTIMISENDTTVFDVIKRKKIDIVPNGIGPHFLETVDVPKEYDLSFVGNLSYAPNIDAAIFLVKEVLPELLVLKKDFKLLIAGANPTAKVRNLAGKNVDIHASVKDIRTAYASSKVFIAPMKIGSGLQNKLLEAMSLGIPCVTTTLANAAFRAIPGKEIMIGDSPEELARNVQAILSDSKLSDMLKENGRKLIEEKYRWASVNEQIEKIILNNT